VTADSVVKLCPATRFAVTPVTDYEPEARTVAQCRQSAQDQLRRRSAPASPRSRAGPDRRPAAAEVGDIMSAPMRRAAVFADAALRRVLEVIDRRRPPAQLRPLLAAGLVDSVGSVSLSLDAGRRGAAVLRRMRLQPAGPRDPQTAAEVFGSYSRGERMHAIACRVEMVDDRWQVVALHIG
jgi:Family of unknown function (DUF6459)